MIHVLILSVTILPLAAMEDILVTTHHLMQAICQVETGCIWTSPGEVKGQWKEGRHGEISPWQLSEAVIQDLQASESLIRRDTAYAERNVLRWLSILQSRGLDHRGIAAAYHRGYSGRGKPEAKAYAERVVSLAQRIAKEKSH